MEAPELVERLLAGERRALARAITWVEDGPSQQRRGAVRLLHPHTGHAHLVGVTGPPGVGKSTLVSRLIAQWRRRERTVAVLAVDPTSPFSGGALLGDRVRLQEHVGDQGVFVRSMASRGRLGGLSWAAPLGLLVLDAAGFDVVVVETVGVGQAEVEIASTADTTVVALAPGMGDAIQTAKAGILEVADLFCVNQADRDGADRTVRDLRDMQRLAPPSGRLAAIHQTIAMSGEGIGGLADGIDEHRAWLLQGGRIEERRWHRARLQLREIASEHLRERFADRSGGEAVDQLARQVACRELDPCTAAEVLLDALDGG